MLDNFFPWKNTNSYSPTKPIGLTLFANWVIKPFTMYAIGLFFLGYLFKAFIAVDGVDIVKLPPGADWAVGSLHGTGKVILNEG